MKRKSLIKAFVLGGFFLLSEDTIGIRYYDLELRIGAHVGGQFLQGYVESADLENIKRVLAIPVIKKLAEA